MAVYRCEVKTLRRAAGRSAVAASAYRSAECLRDQRSGKLFDYRRRTPGIAYREVMSRKDVPEWSHRRDSLWNAAERAEKRCNSVTAREIIVSLPHELNDTQRIELVRDFAGQLVDRYGVAVDVCIHRPDRKGDQRNHHAHLLMTTRRLGPDGFEMKTRELDENKGRGPGEIEAIRQLWERGQNHALEQAGSMERVSRLSNAAQGLDREPQPKLGKAAVALMRRGEPSSRVHLLKEVQKRNAARARKNETEHAGHSPMRQNMAKQAEHKRSAKVEAEKQEAIKRALDAARKQEPAQSAFDAAAKTAAMPPGKSDAPPKPIPRPSAGFNAPAQAKAGKQEAVQRALEAAHRTNDYDERQREALSRKFGQTLPPDPATPEPAGPVRRRATGNELEP